MAEKPVSRRAARALALQVLYSLEFGEVKSELALRKAFLAVPRQGENPEAPNPDQAFKSFEWHLVLGVWQHCPELDGIIEQYAKNWRLERLGRIELNLMRLAMYEMVYMADVPIKVSINEALDLGRSFGEDKSHTFVNGVLDAAAKALEAGTLVRKGSPVVTDKKPA